MSGDTYQSWWGKSRCDCQSEAQVGIELLLENAPTASNRSLEIWAGPACDAPTQDRSEICGDEPIATVNLDKLRTKETIWVDSSRIISPPNGECEDLVETNRTIWFVLDDDGDGEPDFSVSHAGVPVDTTPPDKPDKLSLKAGEAHLVLAWSFSDARSTDLAHFQAICSRVNKSQETSLNLSETIEPAYVRTRDLCSENPDDDDRGPLDQHEPSPEFLCGEADAKASELNIDVSGVELGEEDKIGVRLLVVDSSGNFTIVSPSPKETRPVPSLDFWEIYHASGGDAQGGGCRALGPLTETPPGPVFLLFVLVWILRRRGLRGDRSARRALTLAITMVALVSQGNESMAQHGVDSLFSRSRHAHRSKWSLELRAGPHFPEIDREAGLAGKPFETVYGSGTKWMFQVELDRYFSWRAGSLGLGLSAGHLVTSAPACAEDQGGRLCSKRSSADKTSFRLVPTAAVVVYRFTHLADTTEWELVPYAKAGVVAFHWWVTQGNGTLAQSGAGSAKGTTFGWLTSLGVALRLDSLDGTATRSLRDMGIEHSSLFFDVSRSWTPAFGQKETLRVSDLTWALGLSLDF